MTRRHNTALARDPHLYHRLYGCHPSGRSGTHLSNCYGGKRNSSVFERQISTSQSWLTRLLSKIKSFLKKFAVSK